MKDRYFLDTNIFVYSFDLAVPNKSRRARDLISNSLEEETGVISFQVAQEFINFAIKKASHPMTNAQAQKYFLKVLKPLISVNSSASLYISALSLNERIKCSWYDSIIIASALEASCTILYSEDLQHGRVIEGLKIINPFL